MTDHILVCWHNDGACERPEDDPVHTDAWVDGYHPAGPMVRVPNDGPEL